MDGLRLINGFAVTSGGSIFAFQNHMVVSNVLFEGNESTFAGGAVFSNETRTDFLNVSFVGNHAMTNGGAASSFGADFNLFGVTASGNSAGTSAGAIHSRVLTGSQNPMTRIVNSTFADNTAPEGADYAMRPDAGGVPGDVEIGNSIFASVASGTTSIVNVLADQEEPGRIVSLGNNVVVDDSIGVPATGDVVNTDPMLAALMYGTNGLRGHSLLPGSPALDAADVSLLPSDEFDLDGDLDIGESLPVDLFGGPRVTDLTTVASASSLDVGAVEVSGEIRVSSLNGVIGTLLNTDNAVITGDTGVIVAIDRADVTDVEIIGTTVDDTILVAGLTGREDSGALIPTRIFGGDGQDSATYSIAGRKFRSGECGCGLICCRRPIRSRRSTDS